MNMKKNRSFRLPLAAFSFTFLLLAALQVHAGGGFVNYHPHDLPILVVNPPVNKLTQFVTAPRTAPNPNTVPCDKAACSICQGNRGEQIGGSPTHICLGHDLNVYHDCLDHTDFNPVFNDAELQPDQWNPVREELPVPPLGYAYQKILLASTQYAWRLVPVENEIDESGFVEIQQLLNRSQSLAELYNKVETADLDESQEESQPSGAMPADELNYIGLGQVDGDRGREILEEHALDANQAAEGGAEVEKQAEAGQGESALTATIKVSLWPNPNSGQFQVWMEHAASLPVRYEVINSNGQVVASVDAAENAPTTMDLQHLSSGTYHLIGHADGVRATQQLIIQR